MCRLLRLRARYRKQNKTTELPKKEYLFPVAVFHPKTPTLTIATKALIYKLRFKPPTLPKKKSLLTPSSGSLSFLPQTHTLPLKQFIQRIRRLRILKRLHKILMRQ